jgi:hypothetical protein
VAVVITTYLRDRRGRLQNIRDVEFYKGSNDYVEGVVTLDIHGAVIFSEEEWVDVNYLWRDMIQAVAECRNTGGGERNFPEQTIRFRIERLPAGRLLVSLRSGDQRRATSVEADEFFRAFAAAGLEYFAFERRHLRRPHQEGEPALLQRWLDEG